MNPRETGYSRCNRNIFNLPDANLFYRWKASRLRKLGATIGINVRIAPGLFINYPEKLIIEANVVIGRDVFLHTKGFIRIGENAIVGSRVQLLSASRSLSASIRNAEAELGEMVIGKD